MNSNDSTNVRLQVFLELDLEWDDVPLELPPPRNSFNNNIFAISSQEMIHFYVDILIT